MPRGKRILTEEEKRRKKAEWNKRYYDKNKQKLIDNQMRMYADRKKEERCYKWGNHAMTPDEVDMVTKLETLFAQQLELNRLLKAVKARLDEELGDASSPN
jgi:hypothetical protein